MRKTTLYSNIKCFQQKVYCKNLRIKISYNMIIRTYQLLEKFGVCANKHKERHQRQEKQIILKNIITS